MFRTAVKELRVNIKKLHPALFGDVPYIFAYAAAGSIIAFYAIAPGRSIIPVGRQFNASVPGQRLAIAKTVVNIVRTIRTMMPLIPERRMPLYTYIQRSIGTTIYIDADNVRKSIDDISDYECRGLFHRDTVRILYSQVIPLSWRYSTQLVHGTSVSIKMNNSFHVHLCPLGWPATINTLDDALGALRSVLETLALMHANNIVHRDVRADNILRSPDNGWLLIDFEFCAPTNAKIIEQLPHWPDWCLPGTVFTTADDVWMAGKVFWELTRTLGNAEVDSLVSRMMHLEAERRPTAAEALRELKIMTGDIDQ